MLEIVSGGNLETNEYEAALKLENLIKKEIPKVEEEKDLFIYWLLLSQREYKLQQEL